MEEVVQYLKDPQKFTTLGGKLPKVCMDWLVSSSVTLCSEGEVA